MKVLITGVHGQVGQFVTHKFQMAGWQVYATSHAELDVCCENVVHACIRRFKPHIVINTTAYTAVDLAEKESSIAYQVNALASSYLSAAAADVGAVILHLSTDYVFDGYKQDAYLETDRPNPLNSYGISKLAGEIAVIAANPHHIILRTSWVFSEVGSNFVKTMLRMADNCKELNIVVDQFGGPTYAGDIADSLLMIANNVIQQSTFSQWGVYHYCGDPVVNWYLFAESIFSCALHYGIISSCPRLNAVTSEQYPSLAARPMNSYLNCSKIKNVFGIGQPDWQESLKIMFASFQDRKLSF